MTLRYISGALVAVVCLSGVLAVESAFAQRRDGNLLPQERSGLVTVVGCLMRGSDMRGGHDNRYVLAYPRRGPVANVRQETCTAEAAAPAVELEDSARHGINDWLLNRAVEVNGRLEKETSRDPDNLRELEVRSFRVVPVVPLSVVVATPAPVRPPAPPEIEEAPPEFEQAPVAPAPEPARPAPRPEQAESAQPRPSLPRTTSPLPMIGLLGLLSLAGAITLRVYSGRSATAGSMRTARRDGR